METNTTVPTVLTTTDFRCCVCGECTGEMRFAAQGTGPYAAFIVCVDCIDSGEMDERMADRIRHLETEANMLREVIGRVQLPGATEEGA